MIAILSFGGIGFILSFGGIGLVISFSFSSSYFVLGDCIIQPILSFAGDWILQPILSFVFCFRGRKYHKARRENARGNIMKIW